MAAAQEERFSRKKHDANYPEKAISFCLAQAGIETQDLDFVAFYEKPFIKFDRILSTHITYAPLGINAFLKSIPVWIREKLWISSLLQKKLNFKRKIIFLEHHESHAASSFLTSPFEKAAIITCDGVGEWSTTTLGYGEGNKIFLQKEITFPDSLGLLYSAFTYFLGFKINSGEYKVMGLAPYGKPKYKKRILEHLIHLKEDGSFKLNMRYFSYLYGLKMVNKNFEKLFGRLRRKSEDALTEDDFDIAASIQSVTEEVMIKMARFAKKEFGLKYLCLAGGVALNCVANGKILREVGFEDIYIQPAAGDSGGALGAAAFTYYSLLNHPRQYDVMPSPHLGPEYTDESIRKTLHEIGASFETLSTHDLLKRTAKLIQQQQVIGWFQGKMEFGPRALGGRSILADPRNPKMKDIVNVKIKFRESFRPFAPTVLADKVSDFFDLKVESPFMLLVAPVKLKKEMIPAVTHVDGSARIQTIKREDNPLYYDLIKEFFHLTGMPIMINTSFNVRGEPIVCTPSDAYRCFMGTNLDYLVVGNMLLDKKKQRDFIEHKPYHETFPLD